VGSLNKFGVPATGSACQQSPIPLDQRIYRRRGLDGEGGQADPTNRAL